MITIDFNAFSFLKFELKELGVVCPNKEMKLDKEMSIKELAKEIGLDLDKIEAAFVNHKLVSLDTIIKDGDRIALVPPGGIPNHVKAYVGKSC